MKSMEYSSIMEMERTDRHWYLDRLYRQLKKEADEIKKARGKKR